MTGRRLARFGGLFVGALTLTACAAISGLDQFSTRECSAECQDGGVPDHRHGVGTDGGAISSGADAMLDSDAGPMDPADGDSLATDDSGDDGAGNDAQAPREAAAGECDGGRCLDPAVQISSGYGHTCVLRASGKVYCWGSNSNGQLGDNTTRDRSAPAAVVGLSDAEGIATGDTHTCALRRGGGVVCWGNNGNGQLGDGSTNQRLVPAAIVDGVSATSIAAGDQFTCAVLTDTTVRCWGRNDYGQLGDGSTSERHAPVAVGLLKNALHVAGGETHACATLVGGGAVCWGNNGNGRLGDGTTNTRLAPTAVVGVPSVAQITAQEAHTCALAGEGSVYCWGYNGNGRLGDGTTTDRPTPVLVGTPTIGATALAAGDSHTCAILSDGTARCWGANGNGRLGDGTTTDRYGPVLVSSLTDASGVLRLGNDFSCVTRVGGQVACWGYGGSGRLGDNATGDHYLPLSVYGIP